MEKGLFIALAWEIKESSTIRKAILSEDGFKVISFSGSPLGWAKLFFFEDIIYSGKMEYKGEGYELNGNMADRIY